MCPLSDVFELYNECKEQNNKTCFVRSKHAATSAFGEVFFIQQSHRYPLSGTSWNKFLQTLKKSTSSGCWATKRGIPAKAFSRSLAAILIPWAPGSSLLLMYWFLTLNSLRGCGVRRALICVTIGPSIPATTIVSPSFSFPLIRITSIVVPRPGNALT